MNTRNPSKVTRSHKFSLPQTDSDCRPILEARNALFVLPPIIVNTILCLMSVVRVAYASDGYEQFCYSLCQGKSFISCTFVSKACKDLQPYKWVFPSSGERGRPFAFHRAMKAALVMSWLEPLFMATHVLVILGHVYLEANPTDLSSCALSRDEIITKKTVTRGISPSPTRPCSYRSHQWGKPTKFVFRRRKENEDGDCSERNSEVCVPVPRQPAACRKPTSGTRPRITVDEDGQSVLCKSHSVDELVELAGERSGGSARLRVRVESAHASLDSFRSGEAGSKPRKREFSYS